MKLLWGVAQGVALSVAVMSVCFADDAGSKGTVSVVVTPFTVQPSEKVTISGIAPLDAKGVVAISITPPDKKSPVELRVNPATNGDYSVNFLGTTQVGEYTINATSPGGRIKGQGKFTVTIMEPLTEIEDAIKETRRIETAIKEITADMDAQIPKLPDNPARDTLKAKWAALKPKLAQTSRELADINALLSPLLDAAKNNPKLKPALLPIAKELDDWTRAALPERERIVQQLTASRGKNVTCESLERVVEGFNFASALFNLLGGPANAIKSVYIDFVASQAASLGDKISKKFGFAAQQSSKIAASVAEAKVIGLLDKKTIFTPFAVKEAAQGSIAGMFSDLSSFLAARVFDKYCERMAGNFQGVMHTDFFALSNGKRWWSYDIYYKGRLDLRYAKGTTSGQAVAVNGDFVGQAYKFTLWEDAIRIGWPDLTASAIMFKRALLPKPQINALSFGMTGLTGLEEKAIDVEGKAAATFSKPYTFFVPVEGEIVNNVLTLRMKAATSDYTAAARVVYLIIAPLSIVPVAAAFELPYKEANFFFTRVSKGAPLRFPVIKQGNALKVNGSLKNEQGSSSKGRYDLQFQICNPAPDSGKSC